MYTQIKTDLALVTLLPATIWKLFATAFLACIAWILFTPQVAATSYQGPCILYNHIGTIQAGNFTPTITKGSNCSNLHGSAGTQTSNVLQGTFYLTLPSESEAIDVGEDLVDDGIIDSYTQPFAGINMLNVIRIYWDVDEYSNDMMEYYLIHVYNNSYPNLDIQDIPAFGGSQQGTPNDPERAEQWYLDFIGYNQGREYCGPADKQVKVAVIDNGFATDHPDLVAQITKEINAANNSDDAGAHDTGEGHNHGTLAAGILGATTNNNKGIASISDNTVDMIAIKAASDTAKGSDIDHGLEAIAKAVEEEVDIISISRGAFGADFPLFRQVIQQAVDKDILIVASAGNYTSSDKFYPAAYEDVIAVASVDKEGNQSWFTNYGNRVDIAAPGEGIRTTDLGGGYVDADGTSQSTPLVAGAIGFALAHNKTVEDVFAATTPAPSSDIGQGVLNIGNLCSAPVCERSYPQLDYNDDGKLDNDDLMFIRSQYLNDTYIEDCRGKRYGQVCCPRGYYCDLNVDGEVNQRDAIYWLWIRLGYIDFDICGDGIDNDCDGVIDNPKYCGK